ncbi:MAG: Ig-like domain-containing protein [Fermentimonas sp.]|nr:Ig-like domain-containing protein [Fermentimonas sp.]
MKLHELILSVFIVALISFVSCEKEEEFIKVTDISININSVIIVEGDTLMINAMVVPSNASNKNLSWSSSNDNIVTVDNSGLISAKNVGEATITVSTQDGNRSAVVSIKVIESWISLSQNVIESSLNGGTYEVSLGSSSAWSIVSIPQWVTVSPTIGGTTGLDSTKVNIEVSRFVGTSLNRSGDIIFNLITEIVQIHSK